MTCSICKQEGHNKRSCKNEATPVLEPKIEKKIVEDTYSKELLKEQYYLHKSYVLGRINTTKKIGVKVRLPCIPEDISENIIKNIIHTKLNFQK